MECKNCHSRWEPSQNASRTLTVCPFCGASLAAMDSSRNGIYDNSKDALAHIMREHGVEVLLGSRLKSFFNDYAPGIKKKRKYVVALVTTSGAADILKRNIGAGAEEQEIAFQRAVQRMVDEYATERSEAESVLLEFTAALGWKINIQPQTPPEPATEMARQQTAPASQKRKQTAPVQPKPQTAPAQQVKSAPPKLTPGQRNVKFGKYLWRVLDVQNNRALLLAEEILEQRRYHSEYTSVTWEACDLRKYLNGAFLQSFSGQEQERIAKTEITNADNPWYRTSGGRDTVDKVFLLSIDEVVKYFGDSGDLRARKGWYWENGRDVLKDGKGYYINDEYNSARIAKYRGEEEWWWLRSPGDSGNAAARVYSGGDLSMFGYNVFTDYGGVRPALWLNL